MALGMPKFLQNLFNQTEEENFGGGESEGGYNPNAGIRGILKRRDNEAQQGSANSPMDARARDNALFGGEHDRTQVTTTHDKPLVHGGNKPGAGGGGGSGRVSSR